MNSRTVAWLVLGIALSLGGADARPPHGGASVSGPPPANTQFVSGDCSSSISISGGGLILTGSGSSRIICRANAPKYSGKWYFTFTPSGTVTAPQIGLASGPTVSGTIPSSGSGRYVGQDLYGASYSTASGSGSILYNAATQVSGMSAMAVGVTAAIAINLDTSPNQIWATPDITGTSGFGGGPLWNGVNTSSPEVPGSGAPLASNTGVKFFLPGELYYPTFSSGSSDAGTFSFASNTTLDAKIGAGQTFVYQDWNASGGGAPTPGPLAPQTYVVANAPPWSTALSVSTGARVLAGPGHTPGGGYTNGSPLYLWALSGAGGTTSGGQPAGFSSCAAPANYGGGFNGTPPSQWSGATTVSDNGLTWVCLSSVDYVTMSDMMVDDLPWTPSTPYYQLSFAVNGNNIYTNGNEFGTLDCVSASSGGPTGTGTNISDGTCSWTYGGTRTYTSGVRPWTHQKNTASGGIEITYSYYPTIIAAYGGSSRQVYQAGQNGEADPIQFFSHQDFLADNEPYCRHAPFIARVADAVGCNGSSNSLNFPTGDWGWNLKPLSGDSITDNLTGHTGPLRLDATKGVTFYSNSTYSGCAGSPLGFSDSYGNATGIQIHSVNGLAIDAHSGQVCPGYQHTNGINMTDAIIQSDSGPGVATIDAGWVFTNVAIIWGGSASGGYAVASAYQTYYQNVTMIAASGITNSTAVIQQSQLGLPTFETFNNVNVFGFANPYALTHTLSNVAIGANNASSVSSGFTGSTYTIAGPLSISVDSYQVPGPGTTCSGGAGTCLGLTTSNQFIDPAIGGSLDLRVKSISADIYGGGATSTFNGITNGLDIFGTTRGPRYDIGAEQFVP